MDNGPLELLGDETVVISYLDNYRRLPLLKLFFASTKPLGLQSRSARIRFLRKYFGDGVESTNDLTVGQIRSVPSLVNLIMQGQYHESNPTNQP